jgi:hypothetical protein
MTTNFFGRRPTCEKILNKRQSWCLDMRKDELSELMKNASNCVKSNQLVRSLVETKLSLRFRD